MNRNAVDANRMGPVLVVGSRGFIGRRLVLLLRAAGVDVRAGDRVNCDLRRPADAHALVERNLPAVVVNLARPTHARDTCDHEGHVEIARNLIDAARAAGADRLIHLGSATEFGATASPVADDAPPRPTTPFGRAKAMASALILAADGDGIRTTLLRPFSVYGPGDRAGHLIPAAVDAASSGRSLALARGVERDWVFVDDVASGCALALDGRGDGLAINLASGVGVRNERVVEVVEELAGRPIEVDPSPLPPRPWDAGLVGSSERARQVLGWSACTDLRQGIHLTLVAAGLAGHHPGVAAAG